MRKLIITNGDNAAELLREAKIGDLVLPWRDTLHDGPVPDATDELFAKIRAGHLSENHGIPRQIILDDFKSRLEILHNHNEYEEIALWFEHDLYDQLQILQILDMLARFGRINKVTLVQAPTYLTTQKPGSIGRFEELALPVLDRMFAFASRAWRAYVAEGPEAIHALRQAPISSFVFMDRALLRALQELPGIIDGLSRTERQCLYALDRGATSPGILFAQTLNMEEAAFLGDVCFFSILSGLHFCTRPALTGLPQRFQAKILRDDDQRKEFITAPLRLTEFGQALLTGEADFLSENNLHRWWGGTELTNQSHWRWDDEMQEMEHIQAQ